MRAVNTLIVTAVDLLGFFGSLRTKEMVFEAVEMELTRIPRPAMG
jgi:hypothetical protein